MKPGFAGPFFEFSCIREYPFHRTDLQGTLKDAAFFNAGCQLFVKLDGEFSLYEFVFFFLHIAFRNLSFLLCACEEQQQDGKN